MPQLTHTTYKAKNTTYSVGDRVAERPKAVGTAANSAEGRKRVAEINFQRYGTITEIFTKSKKQTNPILKTPMTPEKLLIAQTNWANGTSLSELSKDLGVSTFTVKRYLTRLNEGWTMQKLFAPFIIAQDPYVKVQWDHLKSPATHSMMRICHVSEFESLMKREYGLAGV
jgi:hypothetical protein